MPPSAPSTVPATRASGSQNILEVVRTALPSLRKSDAKVADALLEDPRRILNATVAETAAIAQVSQPTVIRFCTAIGCEGFQDFKLRLASSLALGTPATHSVILESDDAAAVAEKIFDFTMTSLDWARHHLDKAALGRAVELLAEAGRIEFFGFGASGIVARDAQQKFPLFDVPCGAEIDSHQQVMVASMLRAGDVAVVISNTGATRGLVEIARIAQASGARVIGIVGAETALVNFLDVTLVVETLDNTNIYTPTISRIAALTVVDILSTAVALRRGSAHVERFERMKRHLRFLREGSLF